MNDIEIAGIVLNTIVLISTFIITVSMLHIWIYGVKKSWLSDYFVKLNKKGEVIFKHVLIFIFQFILLLIGTILCAI